MEDFSFSVPQNVIFGKLALGKLYEAAKKIGGKKGYIISGPHLKKIGLVDICISSLQKAGIECDEFTETEGNPSTDTVDKAVEKLR